MNRFGFVSFVTRRLRVTSIRGQLTVGLAATLVPCLAIGFYSTQQYVRSRVYLLTEQRLQAEAELISYGLRQWGLGIAQTVYALSVTPSMQEARIPEIESTFDSLASSDPNRLWRFWSASDTPRLLTYTGAASSDHGKQAEKNQGQRQYYQAAMRGLSSYQVVLSRITGRACLNVSEPIFKDSLSPAQQRPQNVGSLMSSESLKALPVRTDLNGVLVLCIPLQHLGQDTGLQDLFKDERLKLLASDNDRNFLDDPRGFDSAVILVSNSGQLLFPDIEWGSGHIPSIEDIKKSGIPSLYGITRQAMLGKELFATLVDGEHRYLALTAQVDSAWSLVLLLNERKATSAVYAIGRIQALVGISTLLIVLVIIAYRSRTISRPISVAGEALRRISVGDFDIQLAATTEDEIGSFLRNVQLTAERLKLYLIEATSFAVTQKQIDTAKAIQKDFLLAELPSSACYDVQAFSRPALEMGADWYDIVDVGDYIILLVADVCDKGVPSALYMSVFRSLIRSKLLDHAVPLCAVPGDQCSPVPTYSNDAAAIAICESIEQTNAYMASNHNSSMMFATAFVGAVNIRTGEMSYLSAGHESPFIVGASRLEMLDKVSGPAIGIFDAAKYSIFSARLQPGDALVVYSDGLTDARSPANEGWGVVSLRELLKIAPRETAAQLMASIVSSVDQHMAGADQFDDLTIMVFKWRGS